MGRKRRRSTAAEEHLERQNSAYMRNEATLRDLYAAVDEVLEQRGLPVTPSTRAQVINEVE